MKAKKEKRMRLSWVRSQNNSRIIARLRHRECLRRVDAPGRASAGGTQSGQFAPEEPIDRPSPLPLALAPIPVLELAVMTTAVTGSPDSLMVEGGVGQKMQWALVVLKISLNRK